MEGAQLSCKDRRHSGWIVMVNSRSSLRSVPLPCLGLSCAASVLTWPALHSCPALIVGICAAGPVCARQLDKGHVLKSATPACTLLYGVWPSHPLSLTGTHSLLSPCQFLCHSLLPCLLLPQVRQKLGSVKAECFLATTLDEVAWLYNLRGSDVPHNPGAGGPAGTELKHCSRQNMVL